LRTDRPRRRRIPAVPAALVLGCLVLPALAGCRNDMRDQNKMNTYRESTFYPDGSSARLPPAHTVARGELRSDPAVYTGIRDRRPVAEVPFPVTREVLLRGEQRYDIFCSPCHGRTGDGHGMIVTRGYKEPPSLNSDSQRAAQVGHFFDVISQGFGVMPSYAAQIEVPDRWAIAAYIRALQLSQGARLSDLPAPAQQAIAGDLAKAPEAPGKTTAPRPQTSEVP
jgi:mono/diheme cytochrome c family protein